MDEIIYWIKEYCDRVGIDALGVYQVNDTSYILIVLNDCYIGTDNTEIIYKGIATIFKEHGIKVEEE